MKRSIKLLMLIVPGILSLSGCDNCRSVTPSDSPAEPVTQATTSTAPVKLVYFHSDNFSSDVLESEKVVLVDFYAPSCGVCTSMEPVVKAVASHFDGQVTVGKLNVDENKAIASEYGVEMIPQFLVFKNGQLVKRLGGPVSQKEMIAKIQAALVADGKTR